MSKIKQTFSIEYSISKEIEQLAKEQRQSKSETLARAVRAYRNYLQKGGLQNDVYVKSLQERIESLENQLTEKDAQINALISNKNYIGIKKDIENQLQIVRNEMAELTIEERALLTRDIMKTARMLLLDAKSGTVPRKYIHIYEAFLMIISAHNSLELQLKKWDGEDD